MSEQEFRARRRQKFLTEHFYQLNVKQISRSENNDRIGIANGLAEGDFNPFGQGAIFSLKLDRLKLEYTAGTPIDSLRPFYADAMQALGEWHAAEYQYSVWLQSESDKQLRLDMTPIEFEDLFHYQLALDMVSLGVLLGEGDALRQIAAWMQSARDTDLLFDSLLEPALAEPPSENTSFFHVKPYDPLIDAFWTVDTPEEASAKVGEYLAHWYASFSDAPWHDGHLIQRETDMPYYGYWSFEAAAVCVIHGIDDAPFRDHLVYPKDLADWARANGAVTRIQSGRGSEPSPLLRHPAGHTCPRSGWWFTPAKEASRRHFKQDEVFPEIEGNSYGATFWQWSPDQSDPSLLS